MNSGFFFDFMLYVIFSNNYYNNKLALGCSFFLISIGPKILFSSRKGERRREVNDNCKNNSI